MDENVEEPMPPLLHEVLEMARERIVGTDGHEAFVQLARPTRRQFRERVCELVLLPPEHAFDRFPVLVAPNEDGDQRTL
jgi:hypothetical protein